MQLAYGFEVWLRKLVEFFPLHLKFGFDLIIFKTIWMAVKITHIGNFRKKAFYKTFLQLVGLIVKCNRIL
ncbi:MAG: hypothetical protein CML01_12355 [Pseudomonas sp.]|nr:hypothetical protein [Pseudomonas sp.]MBK59581.1 hypothetical protein [Pseudomonas sp.]